MDNDDGLILILVLVCVLFGFTALAYWFHTVCKRNRASAAMTKSTFY